MAGRKRVLLAAPRGYCAGVDRAVVAVEKALERYGAPVYVRKQIVHNIHVVTELEEKGAIFVEEVDEVPEGAHVVFSAHGVSPAVVNAASDRGLHAIDATCPLVTKVHREGRAITPATTSRSCSSVTRVMKRSRGRQARPGARHGRELPGRGRHRRREGPQQGRLALADHSLGRRDDGDGESPPHALPRAAQPRRPTTSATPRRTARSRSRRSRPVPTS